MLITACREAPVSYFQLLKLALGIIGSVIRLLSTLFHYFGPDEEKNTLMKAVVYTGEWPRPLGWPNAIMNRNIGGVTVHHVGLRSHFRVHVHLALGQLHPAQVVYQVPAVSQCRVVMSRSAKYDNGRYLNGSGVYFSHSAFARCNNTAGSSKVSKFKLT